MNYKRAVTPVATAIGLTLLASGAMAAGTATGVEAGFFALGGDLNTVLQGAGGYVVLLLAVIIGAITLAVTGRWGQVAISFGVAIFLGYGLTTLTSFGGVTASTNMLALAPIESSSGPV